ncbi:MAG: lactate racemase domain-containing protein [Candidatus Hodarchaeales archaeon]
MTDELIFSGDDVVVQHFPENIEIVYPNPPLPPIKDFLNEIRKALDNPSGMGRLDQLVKADSKIIIAFDDVSVPLPLTRPPDPRSLVIEEIIHRLRHVGVKKTKIELICATGLHRKCKPDELEFLLGKKIFKEFYHQISNHDPANTVRLKELSDGTIVDVNKKVLSSDLLIYVSLPFTPMNGGYKSVAVGLGSVDSIVQHHIPEVLDDSPLMDPKKSQMHQMIDEIGKTIESQVPIFQIEVTLNNDFYSGFFRWLWAPTHGKISKLRRILLKAMTYSPQKTKSFVRRRYRANYQPTGIFCGKVDEVHSKALELIQKQMLVTVEKRYNVLLVGIPNMTPYNVGTDPNPLLIHTMLNGYLFNSKLNSHSISDKNVVIGFNPINESFSREQHEAYEYFYRKIQSNRIPERTVELEEELLNNNQLQQAYQKRYSYHPIHPLMAYYWGTRGTKALSTIIVSKNTDSSIFKQFQWQPVKNLESAINKAKKMLETDKLSIIYPFIPPLSVIKEK